MKTRFRKIVPALFVGAISIGTPTRVRADMFGGDLLFLAEIVSNTLEELIQLKALLGTGMDTLDLLKDVNRGISDALELSQDLRGNLSPGVLSELHGVQESMAAVEKLYGLVPIGPEAALQKTTDQSVAEAIDMHNEAFRYADQVDPEAERIKEQAHLVNPQGAGKLTAESLGVVINVMNQVLRTNAAMLKLQGEQVGLANRREKLGTEQFRTEYQGIAKAFADLKPEYDLPSLSR